MRPSAAIPMVGSWTEEAMDTLLSCPPIPEVDELESKQVLQRFSGK